MAGPLPRVFIIGSSTTVLFDPYLLGMTAGVFDIARNGEEPGEMARALADLDHPQGASAGDSAHVVAYLRALEEAGAFQAEVALVHAGLHDIKRDAEIGRNRVSLDAYRANCRTIAPWFLRRGVRRFEADLHAYNAAAGAVMADHGVTVLDLAGFTRTLAPPEALFKDHIHLRDSFVRRQAVFVAGFLHGIVR